MPFSSLFSHSKKLYDGPLRPNCLLTRYPIIFLEKPKSLFSFNKYFNDYWGDLPSFTAEHGYEVHRMVTADLTLSNCQNLMETHLKSLKVPTHIVAYSDLLNFPKLEETLSRQNLCRTWTFVHRSRSFHYNLWLDHLISLAELDLSMKNEVCDLQKLKLDPF